MPTWSVRRSELLTVTHQMAPLTDMGCKHVEANSALRTRGKVCYRCYRRLVS